MKKIILLIILIININAEGINDCCSEGYTVKLDINNRTYSKIFSDIHMQCTGEALNSLKENMDNHPRYSCSEKKSYSISSRYGCTTSAPGDPSMPMT